jgi:hypothetical protein
MRWVTRSLRDRGVWLMVAAVMSVWMVGWYSCGIAFFNISEIIKPDITKGEPGVLEHGEEGETDLGRSESQGVGCNNLPLTECKMD